MNAEKYLSAHWGPRHVWTHLKNKKHQTRLRRCTELVEGSSFCDVGCAYGHSTEIMAGFREGEWTGIEFASDAVVKATAEFPNRVWLYIESVDALSYASGMFDSVVCSEVMEHVEEDGMLVKRVIEMARIKAVFSTPSIKVRDPGHLRVYTEESLHKLFAPWPHHIYHEHPFFYIAAMSIQEKNE